MQFSFATQKTELIPVFCNRSFALFHVFGLNLASPLASIMPSCLGNFVLNPAQVTQVGVIGSSAYSVIQVPESALRRLVAYRIFPS